MVLAFVWGSFAVATENCGEGDAHHWRKIGHDVPYQPGATPMALDIYVPNNRVPPSNGFKTILMIHGGCFAWGGKAEDDTMEYVDRLINAGYAVVSIDYHLTNPEKNLFHFPTSMLDSQDALRWLRQHGEDYGLNVSKIVAMGYSSGATLADYLGTRPAPGQKRVDGVIDFFGRTDFMHSYTQAYIASLGLNYLSEENKENHQIDCGELYAGKTHEDADEVLVEASVLTEPTFDDSRVLTHVDKESACTLIVHGVNDQAVSVVHSRLLHAQLVETSRLSTREKRACFPALFIPNAIHMLREPKTWKRYPPHENIAWNAVCPFLSHILGDPPPKRPTALAEGRRESR